MFLRSSEIIINFSFIIYLLVVQVQNFFPQGLINYQFSISQGNTTETSALFRIVYPKKLKVKYSVLNSKGESIDVKRSKLLSDHSEFKVEHIKVKNLSLENYTKVNSDQKKWKDEKLLKHRYKKR